MKTIESQSQNGRHLKNGTESQVENLMRNTNKFKKFRQSNRKIVKELEIMLHSENPNH